MNAKYHAYSCKKKKPGSIRDRKGCVSRSEAMRKVQAVKREEKKVRDVQ